MRKEFIFHEVDCCLNRNFQKEEKTVVSALIIIHMEWFSMEALTNTTLPELLTRCDEFQNEFQVCKKQIVLKLFHFYPTFVTESVI